MSDFVNYNKRSVTLPKGCKDLVDVLREDVPHDSRVARDSLYSSRVVTGSKVIGKLSEVAKYIARAVDSRASMYWLDVASPALTVAVWRLPSEAMLVPDIIVRQNTETERGVRDFFGRRGIRLPDDSGIPKSFHAEIPVLVNYRICPVPVGVDGLTKMIADLFGEVCKLTGDSDLEFHHVEMNRKA